MVDDRALEMCHVAFLEEIANEIIDAIILNRLIHSECVVDGGHGLVHIWSPLSHEIISAVLHKHIDVVPK